MEYEFTHSSALVERDMQSGSAIGLSKPLASTNFCESPMSDNESAPLYNPASAEKAASDSKGVSHGEIPILRAGHPNIDEKLSQKAESFTSCRFTDTDIDAQYFSSPNFYKNQLDFLNIGSDSRRNICEYGTDAPACELGFKIYSFLNENVPTSSKSVNVQDLSGKLAEILRTTYKFWSWSVVLSSNEFRGEEPRLNVSYVIRPSHYSNLWVQTFETNAVTKGETENKVISNGMGPYGLFQYSKYWRNVELLALVLWADPNVLSSPEAADKNNTVRTALDKEFGKGLASSKSFSVYSVVRNMGSFGGSYVFAVGIPKQSATTTFGLNLATNEHLKYPICITGADGMFLVWPEISNASLISDSLVSVSPGGGRRSTVYKGRLKGNFSVAVKDIPILAGSDKIQHNKEIMEKIYEKFEKLRHPNIARHIYSHLYIPPPDEFGFPVYRVVMTFCGGGTLANRVKDIIKPKQLIDWSNGILSGLQYLHEANIIHRDLKGEHIMFQGPGQGYGLVQIISLGRTPTASSQSYVSPALSRTAFQPQDAEVFTSYDIWSWACVVIQMVTGVAPKAASLVGESKSKYVEGTPTVLVDLPDGLVQLVRECLEMDPKLRPSSSDLLNSCSSKDIEQRCGSWICPSRKRVEPSSIRAGMSQQV